MQCMGIKKQIKLGQSLFHYYREEKGIIMHPSNFFMFTLNKVQDVNR